MNNDLSTSEQSGEFAEESQSNPERPLAERTRVSIDLDSEILARIKHLTNDPSRVIETAIKQWLKGERNEETDLTRTFPRNPSVPPQGEWND